MPRAKKQAETPTGTTPASEQPTGAGEQCEWCDAPATYHDADGTATCEDHRADPGAGPAEKPPDATLSDGSTYGQNIVEKVRSLHAMTKTAAWARNYEFLKNDLAFHTAAIFDPECTPRQVMEHRETVLAYNRFIEQVKAPLRELEDNRKETPLFAEDLPKNVTWDEQFGRVVME